ncbi:hypothetical protein QQF64_034042, partial [Cirrhinus molitorella]
CCYLVTLEKLKDLQVWSLIIKIGDKVRVKLSVVFPKHGWGSVTHKSIGVVK